MPVASATTADALPVVLEVALVACGPRPALQLGPLLESLATHAPRTAVFVFADAVARAALAPCTPRWRRTLRLEVRHVDELDADLGLHRGGQGGGAAVGGGRFHCATAKLDLASLPLFMRTHVLLVLDADTLLRGPLTPLVRHAEAMVARRAPMGLVAESEEAHTGWYAAPHTHPAVPSTRRFPPPTGVNSGVMLLNLPELRARGLVHASAFVPAQPARRTDRAAPPQLALADQDMLNEWLAPLPRPRDNAATSGRRGDGARDGMPSWLRLPCEWNTRPDSRCNASGAGGIVHGNRALFTPELAALALAPPSARTARCKLCRSLSGSGTHRAMAAQWMEALEAYRALSCFTADK